MKLNRTFQWLLWTPLAFLLLVGIYIFIIYKGLPRAYSLGDYKPPLITFVFDREGKLIGEFFKERRTLTSFEEFPPYLIQAFVAAEDGRFFDHKGLNYKAIFRAFLANIKAGKKVQGGSTITQQVARSLLLSRKKTYTRKIQEAILASRMEAHLTKEEILYLYLNQIYLGHGAYGVGMASHIYFKKEVKDLTLEECALLAGLPQAPSRFSPISDAKKSKNRQIYVLSRMVEEGYLSEEEARETQANPVKVFMRENYLSKAPYFVETIRQLLVDEIGEEALLTAGLEVHTSLDLNLQKEAQIQLKKGLKDLDKRQGFRGPLKNISSPEEQIQFFEEREKKWISSKKSYRIILAEGEDGFDYSGLKTLNAGEQVQGIVQKVQTDQAYVDLIFGLKGVIPLKTSQWARKPNKKLDYSFNRIESMQSALKKGDVIWVEVQDIKEQEEIVSSLGKNIFKDHLLVSLEQEPLVEGALISFDQETSDVITMVGGYDFSRSQFNRAYQAKRQTGSVFKPVVYTAALDKGFFPNSIIADEPVVYEDEQADLLLKAQASDEKEEDLTEIEKDEKKWKPSNYSMQFTGDILFRNSLIKSLNIPTVKLIEKVGIPWVEFYSRRLGITSSLNSDYTLALGSSSTTLYEMTKAFSIFGRGGKNIFPSMIRKVINPQKQVIVSDLSLDRKFPLDEMQEEFKKSWDDYWKSNKEESKVFFKDLHQIISESTAYLITSLLQGVILEGTGRGAKRINRPVAGKTGTTNGYYDAWFIGYSPQIATGVWVGFDNEESLGQSETGARAALPIWYKFMNAIHKELEPTEFKVPESIVFAHIDNETGYLASSSSKDVVKQAFLEGTEPREQKETLTDHEDQDFLREDMAL